MGKSAENHEKKGGLFEDLSIAQIAAGALAAVTSMLLASRIGIYGSVIGVAVGSIVSAVASQLYKKFLTASAEKLRELKPGDTGYLAKAPAETDSANAQDITKETPGVQEGAADKTAVLQPTSMRQSRTPRIDDEGLKGDATIKRARAQRERKKKLQRRIIAVSVASAVVAVAVSAVAVDLFTQGEGLGTRPEPIIAPSAQDQAQVKDGASVKTTPSDDDAKANDSANKSGDQQGSSDTPKPGTTDTDSNAGTDSGSGSSGSDAGTSSGSGNESGTGDTSEGGSGSSGSGGSDATGGGNTSGSGSADSNAGSSGNTGTSSGSPTAGR
ncbi:hypothetical protein [Eggerthella sp. YY7918]|uniref:hypothetical protein n=1 Tax=Eggerthella sp. (strain YY7918) TaxID=502558 RepID=UPI0002170EDC|nr:hypothetical protein [Eggerthella sp. YY7918]BAK43646.1 hypothetical protein EGYY_04230 [Eggerthella sp. YY7918]